jgi:hypothetical protein
MFFIETKMTTQYFIVETHIGMVDESFYVPTTPPLKTEQAGLQYFETTCFQELDEEEVKPHLIHYLTEFMNHYNDVKELHGDFIQHDKTRNRYEKVIQYLDAKMQELNLLIIKNLSIAELLKKVVEIIHHMIPYNKKMYYRNELFISHISLVKGEYVN